MKLTKENIKDTLFAIIATAIIAATGAMIITSRPLQEQRQTIKSTVYEVCNISRVTDEVDENTCGLLQDRFNLEYLCEDNNRSAVTKCWMEDK